MLNKIFYYPKRILNLGFINSLNRINYHLNKKIYKIYWKNRALKFKANYSWDDISKKHDLQDFKSFFEELKHKKIWSSRFDSAYHERGIRIVCAPILRYAMQSMALRVHGFIEVHERNIFRPDKLSLSLLRCHYGSTGCLPCEKKCIEVAKNFYQDIKIKNPQSKNFDDFSFDIKSVWEPARFQNIFEFGYKNFCIQVTGFIDKNPFLLGQNWVCPMEVAIRAINLIWGFYFFKDCKEISIKFWQKFICSLYEHAKYLENNWETSDKPNNHYLADLIGYFYLTFFFDQIPSFQDAKKITYQKLLEQFDHQIYQDGTCYEGSTNYHKLVTEIFLHFYLLAQREFDVEKIVPKLNKMFLFLQDCSDQNGNLVQIGDNDSGKIWGETSPEHLSLFFRSSRVNSLREFVSRDSNCSNLSHYPNFGLSIIKNQNWHITFRHPTFKNYQPTGHFHQDELSITLSLDGIPILVDPGTFTYTANSKWRNFMRSVAQHNTFYLDNAENLETYDLFQLPKYNQQDSARIEQKDNLIEIENFFEKYKKFGIIQNRKIKFDQKKNYLMIEDSWIFEKKDLINQNKKSFWNLIFHPEIEIFQKDQQCWFILYKKNIIAQLKSDIEFKIEKSFYSKEYGNKKGCLKLSGKKELKNVNNRFFIIITKTNPKNLTQFFKG